jgi:hypothetical protein
MPGVRQGTDREAKKRWRRGGASPAPFAGCLFPSESVIKAPPPARQAFALYVMIIEDPDDADAKLPGRSTRMSTTTLGTLDENVTHNTLAWSRLLLDGANASDLTLVPPRGENDREPAVLVFSQDSVFNATVSLAGWPVYRLRSDTRGMKTDLFSADETGKETLVCSYERRMLGSVLKWPNEEKVQVRKYIRPTKSRSEGYVNLFVYSVRVLNGMSRARHAAVFDFEGITYEWRIDMMGKMAVRPILSFFLHTHRLCFTVLRGGCTHGRSHRVV